MLGSRRQVLCVCVCVCVCGVCLCVCVFVVCVYVCVLCHAQIHNGLTYVTLTINLDSCLGWLFSLTLPDLLSDKISLLVVGEKAG